MVTARNREKIWSQCLALIRKQKTRLKNVTFVLFFFTSTGTNCCLQQKQLSHLLPSLPPGMQTFAGATAGAQDSTPMTDAKKGEEEKGERGSSSSRGCLTVRTY